MSSNPPNQSSGTGLTRRSSMGIKYKTKKQREEERNSQDGVGEDTDDMCAICFCEMTLPFRTSCGHSFCFLCLKALFTNQYDFTTRSMQLVGTCPLCRATLNLTEFERAAKVEESAFLEDLETDWVWKYSGRNSGFWLFEPQYYEELETKYRAFLQWQQDERTKQLNDLLAQQAAQQAAAITAVVDPTADPNATTSASTSTSTDTTDNSTTQQTATSTSTSTQPATLPLIPGMVDGDNDVAPCVNLNPQVFIQLLQSPASGTASSSTSTAPTDTASSSTSTAPTDTASSSTSTAASEADQSVVSTDGAVSDAKVADVVADTVADVKSDSTDATPTDGMMTDATTTDATPTNANTTDATQPTTTNDDNDNEDEDEDDLDEDDYDDEDDEDDADYQQYIDNLRRLREEEEKKRKEEFSKQRYCQLHIGSTLYIIDFIDMVQYPYDQPTKRRHVKREPKIAANDAKGVSGVTFINRVTPVGPQLPPSLQTTTQQPNPASTSTPTLTAAPVPVIQTMNDDTTASASASTTTDALTDASTSASTSAPASTTTATTGSYCTPQ